MSKFVKIMDLILKYVLVTLSLSMVAIIFAQVITRYFLKIPLVWSEELARYLFMWTIFLGSAVAVGNKGHVVIDFVIRLVPEKYMPYNELLVNSIIVVYLVFMTYSSFQVLPVVQSSLTSALGISYAYVYAALPVSCIIMAIYLLRNFIDNINAIRKGAGK